MSLENMIIRDAIVSRLADLQQLNRPVPRALLDEVGGLVKLSSRQVRRRIARERCRREGTLEEPRPRAYQLTRRDLELYFELDTNVQAVWDALVKEGAQPPSVRTLQRAFQRELTAAERAFAKTGIDGRRANTLQLRHEVQYRNQVWQIDAWLAPVWVITPRGHEWIKVWVIVVIDCKTRAIVGHVVDLDHTAAHVLAAFKRAILPDEELGPFSGLPDMIVSDNGLEFTAGVTTAAYALFGVYGVQTKPYSPEQKGKVERVLRTFEQEWASKLPFYTDGPRRPDGKLYGPDTKPLSVKQLVASFDLYVQHYNTSRPHSALGGLTPLEAWEADPTPLRTVAPEDTIGLLLPRTTRRVLKTGVRFQNQDYVAPELNRLVGREVDVVYIPHDFRTVDVFYAGEYVATARPSQHLTAEERLEVTTQRRRDNQRAAELMRERSRRARARFALDGEPEVEDDPVDPSQESSPRPEPKGGSVKRDQARRDLLGLGDLDEPIEDVDPGDGTGKDEDPGEAEAA